MQGTGTSSKIPTTTSTTSKTTSRDGHLQLAGQDTILARINEFVVFHLCLPDPHLILCMYPSVLFPTTTYLPRSPPHQCRHCILFSASCTSLLANASLIRRRGGPWWDGYSRLGSNIHPSLTPCNDHNGGARQGKGKALVIFFFSHLCFVCGRGWWDLLSQSE